jgi:hypothetical protein
MGASVNAVDARGRTPLHMAHPWAIRLLIKSGADPNAQVLLVALLFWCLA